MIINDLDGYYIVFDTKNWNTELDTLAVKLSDHVNFITKVGFLGYKGYSPDHGDNSSTFGLNVDASNISFGAIYKF